MIQIKTKNIQYLLALIGLVLVYFINSGIQALYADEPTRALGALEMMINQDWIPTINGRPYINKPPLYNWILTVFFWLFGFSEFVIRLPAILSMLAFGGIIYLFIKEYSKSKKAAFFTSIAVLTSGNILFYSSLLGHIDALFSLVIFSLFMVVYKYGSQDNWRKLFTYSYLLCFVGFMLKGPPAIVFQGITLIASAFFFKRWKKLFSLDHILGGLLLIIPLGIYLTAFATRFPLDEFVVNLWQESSKRTVVDKSLLESIGHIFSFPFQFTIDTAPWSLLGLIFIYKPARTYLKSNAFLKFCLLIFISNIIIYWLAPDNRARYVFMLYPLFFSVIITTLVKVDIPKFRIGVTRGSRLLTALVLVGLIAGLFIQAELYQKYIVEFIVVFILLAALILTHKKLEFLIPLTFLLITLRLAFNIIAIPERIPSAHYTREKAEAYKVAKLSKDKPLYLCQSNLQHSSTYYITQKRNEIVNIVEERDSIRPNVYYLIPTRRLVDSSITKYHYTFVRRHQELPFALVEVESKEAIKK